MMRNDTLIKEFKTKMLNELLASKLCELDVEDFKNYAFNFFKELNSLKQNHGANLADFRDFAQDIYYHNCDTTINRCENRLSLFIEEISQYYIGEPYFWSSNFQEYLVKLNFLLGCNDY